MELTSAIPVAQLQQLCEAILRRCGLSDVDARTGADVLVTTDTYGVFTHGTKSLAGYVRRLQGGGLKANAVPRIEREGPGWAVIDGQSALAMVTSVFAMNTAIEKAKATGVAYVGVRNSCHFGAAGYYVNLAAKADMIGLAMANDCPCMVAPGARKPVLGTNPFAYAVPAGEVESIFLDIASAAVASGKVWAAKNSGRQIPDTWLVDAKGLPTTDPSGFPQCGFMMPFAGHKGYGIAVMIEVLSAMISGAGSRGEILSWMLDDPAQPTLHGAAFLAINLGAMTAIDQFKRRVDKMIREIHQTPKAEGATAIYLPGEMEWQKRREALVRGIALPDDVRASLRGLSEQLGLKIDWLQQQGGRRRFSEKRFSRCKVAGENLLRPLPSLTTRRNAASTEQRRNACSLPSPNPTSAGS
jgi:ureidoglycolate dehydrogenase (NAD+)